MLNVKGHHVMKHTVLLLAVVMLIPLAVSAKKKLITVKVEVVEPTTTFQELAGNRGSILGRRTGIDSVSLKVIINGDHALLRCYENHQGCNTLGPGTYDAEVSVPKWTGCLARDTSGKLATRTSGSTIYNHSITKDSENTGECLALGRSERRRGTNSTFAPERRRTFLSRRRPRGGPVFSSPPFPGIQCSSREPLFGEVSRIHSPTP